MELPQSLLGLADIDEAEIVEYVLDLLDQLAEMAADVGREQLAMRLREAVITERRFC